MKTTHILPHGYSATIQQDESPDNPWKAWDFQPPILTFNLDRYHGRLEDYKTGLCLRDIYWKIPVRFFGPKNRPRILEAMGIEAEDAHRYLDHPRKANAEAWFNAIGEILPEDPTSWREAEKYFEMLEFLCSLAKIPCKWDQSTGYCQGHACWVFIAAMPEWVEEAGWNPEDKPASLQKDIDLWSAWAWGDVYGVSEILRPDGTEIPDADCWSFYGDDHEESGLLDHCRSHVEADLLYLAKESAEAFDAACRGIITAA